VLAAGDIHVVALRRGLGRSSVPSKLYSILAAGRPVLASVDEGTEVVRVLDAVGAGYVVPPEDSEAFTAMVEVLMAADRAEMGERGRAFVEQWVSPAGVAAAYVELFQDLVAGKVR
jgi:colanic acid biosynthesis glycosyl transferase WcaI